MRRAILFMQPGVVTRREQWRRFDEGLEQRRDPLPIVGGEIPEHMSRDQVLVARMADAEAHPPEIARAELLGDRAQPIVPGDAAAGLDAHLAGREVELVVADHDLRQRQLVEARGFGDRVTGTGS